MYICVCVCPSESAVDGAMPIPSLQTIPSGSKLIGAAMLRFYSDNDHKHSGYSRMTDPALMTPPPSRYRLTQASTRARDVKGGRQS